MTMSSVDIEQVKASVDAALDELQQKLRELNCQVWSFVLLFSFFSWLIFGWTLLDLVKS
jgi:hypothetical protein